MLETVKDASQQPEVNSGSNTIEIMFAFSAEALKRAETSEDAGNEAKDGDSRPVISPRHGAVTSMDDVVFALFLDCRADATPGASTAENALATLIRLMQPMPSMAHVELLIADSKGDPHFATYIGRTAGWGASFGENPAEFYMNLNAGLWRAVPIVSKNAAAKVRSEIGWHVDTPYSLARYVCSVPPLRSFAGLLSDDVGDPAHCAALTARCLKRAMGSSSNPIKKSPVWYGPSTLWLQLTHHNDNHHNHHNQTSHVHGAPESTLVYTETLLHGRNEAIRELSKAEKNEAILHMANRALHAARGSDSVGVKLVQKQLATALLRSIYH